MNLPRVRIRRLPTNIEEIRDLEAVRPLFSSAGGNIFVDGRQVTSFDELCQLASHSQGKEFVDVLVLFPVDGG